MAHTSVSDSQTFINHQIKRQEIIEACLWRLEALMTVASMAEDFYRLPETTLHSYFLIAGDLIDKVVKINQKNLNVLLKNQQKK